VASTSKPQGHKWGGKRLKAMLNPPIMNPLGVTDYMNGGEKFPPKDFSKYLRNAQTDYDAVFFV
jgi:hypothetical protein